MTAQRIFISHASEDEAVVGRIIAYLEANGAPCWVSSRDIHPKMIYAEAITQAMRDAQSCAVVISRAANESKAVKRELELASRYEKPFIPIRIDSAEPGPGLDYYLNNTQWVDYGRDRERALDRIVAAYNARVHGAPAPRRAPRRASNLASLLIAGAVLLICVGGWFGWTQLNRPAQATALPVDLAGSFLMGSYHWDGVACGEGPTITQENGALVFTMPGTPTYRHEVVNAERDTQGYALRVETRVVEPAEHAGESYTLSVNRGVTELEVISDGRTDTWRLCSGIAAE